MSDEIEKSIREFESGVGSTPVLTTNYQEIVAAGLDVYANKASLRNNLSDQVRLRVDGDDDQTFTVKAGSAFFFGGFSKLKGKKIEAKIETNVADSFILNLIN
jgi:hypothetical protein